MEEKPVRIANLPNHCGNCIFYLWEESTFECRHPSIDKAEDLTLKDLIEDPEIEVDYENNVDLVMYDGVCDYHTKGHFEDKGAKEIRAQAEKEWRRYHLNRLSKENKVLPSMELNEKDIQERMEKL